MHTTTHNTAPEAVQAKPCQNCRDNFPLPEPKDHFDRQVVADYTARRSACTACPGAQKPCLVGMATPVQPLVPDVVQRVLQAFDATESLRTVLRACQAVAALAECVNSPRAAVCMESLGELLHLQGAAMAQRLDTLDGLIDTTRAELATRPTGDRAMHFVLDASDHAVHLRQAQLAFVAVASMVPFATDSLSGENLSAALHVLIDALNERATGLDDQLGELHAALVPTNGGGV